MAIPAVDTSGRPAPLVAAPITVAHGDGIGPEIMAATLAILDAAGARLAIETIEVGERLYEAGITAGIAPEAWESLRRTRTFLKAPITTPQGKGFKSLNVTIRKTLGLYANARATNPTREFAARANRLIAEIGPIPAVELGVHLPDKPQKQRSRLVKTQCARCGYLARVTRKWLDDVGPPHCPRHGAMAIEPAR